jgi:SAM-dependent methyltransferase
MGAGFWNRYALTYNRVRQLAPYQRMFDDAITLSGLPPGTSPQRVLDVGCGTGYLNHALARWNIACRLTGVDYSPVMLARARAEFPDGDFRQADLNSSLVDQGTAGPFHVFFAANICYAVDSWNQTLRHLAKTAEPEAVLVVTTPAAGGKPGAILREHFATVEAQGRRPRKLRFMASGLPVWLFNLVIMRRYQFMDEARMRAAFEGSGWKITTLGRTYAGQNWLIRAQRMP